MAGNLVKPLLSLYGTKWRERGYGLRDLATLHEVTVLNPRDLFLKVKTCFSQKRYGHVIERLKMRTNENSRSTADDGITLRMFLAVLLPSQNVGCQSQKILKKCVFTEQFLG